MAFSKTQSQRMAQRFNVPSSPVLTSRLYLDEPPNVQYNDADLVVWTYILKGVKNRTKASEAAKVWLQARLKAPYHRELYKAVYRAVTGVRPERVPAQKSGYRTLNCADHKEFDGFLKDHFDDFSNITRSMYVENECTNAGWTLYCYYEQPLVREMREVLEEEKKRQQIFGGLAKVMKGMRR